ncbi:MAG TPA: hypothetical protein PLA16_01995 [Chitinophagales bacterium]|nr:hypothetical protein [Chitinophagales bacterium]
MKKVLFLFLLFIGAASMMTSCKKEEEKISEKQRVFNLLTSGKWYYSSSLRIGDDEPNTCFDENDYYDFNTDSTFEETWDFGEGGTFEVAEDGKSVSLVFTSPSEYATYTPTIVSISESSLKLQFDFESSDYEYTFSKTASDGCPK